MPIIGPIEPEFVINTDENVRLLEKHLTRKCGDCYACCVHLGIEELRKWPGQTCKHLDGTIADKRCTVYENRPKACSSYYCGWIANMGPEDLRPDKSGVLVTLYPPHDYSDEQINYDPNEMSSPFSATIHVTDDDLAGDLADPDSKIGVMLNVIVGLGCNDIRIMDSPARAGQRVVHMHNGNVRLGRLRRSSKYGYEELVFHTEEPPIGRYITVERGSDEEKKWAEILGHRVSGEAT